MSAKTAADLPARELELYRKVVAATPGAELKGASLPYTSVNGHMCSFLDKTGACAIRLGKPDREAFMQEFETALYVHGGGAELKEYVAMPPSLLGDVKAASRWLSRSLAYGDSLTFGSDAETQGRHRYEDRWPSVLEAGLGGQARVIAEGLGGRTTAFDDFSALADRNGARTLPTLLDTHKPLDLVIIMLGTNDLKIYLNGTAFGAAMGVKRLVEIVRQHPYGNHGAVPQVVMVSPPLTVETDHADLKPMFAPRSDEAKLFAGFYGRIAGELGCGFFDAATVAVATPIDGVHLDARNTRAIGDGLVPVARKMLGL